MTRLLAGAVFVAFGVLCGYTLVNSFNSPPHLVIDAPHQDVGTVVLPFQVPYVYFKLTNEGAKPLSIRTEQQVGLSDVALHKPLLYTGEHVSLRGILAVPEAGSMAGSITLATNDPKRPTVELTATGQIARYLSIRPESLDFGEIHKSELPVTQNLVIQKAELPLIGALSEIAPLSIPPYLFVTITSIDRERVRIDATLSADAPTGLLHSLLIFGDPAQNDPYGESRVVAYVKGDFMPDPPAILFLRAIPGVAEQRTFYVRGPFEEGFHLKLLEEAVGGCYQLAVTGVDSVSVTFSGAPDCLQPVRDYQVLAEVRNENEELVQQLAIPMRAVPSMAHAYHH